MSTSAVTPDPYAAYGGSVSRIGGADPYAAYGGQVSAPPAAPPDTRNAIQKEFDNLTTVTPAQEKGHSWLTNKVQELGAGAIQGVGSIFVHPEQTLAGVANTVAHPIDTAEALARQAYNNPAQTAGNIIGGALLGEGTSAGAGALRDMMPAKPIPGQNYAPAHAAAFEGAIAPATAMGKNFIPQEITPEALSPIRATASRMAAGTPEEQQVVAAVSDSKSPLTKVRAYRSIVNNALNDLEAQHSPALAVAKDVPVDTAPLVKELQAKITPTMDPSDVSAIRKLVLRVRNAKTIGDLNRFRQELNIETSPEYRQSQIQAGRSGLSAQAASDLADSVRGAYYDNLEKATGIDFSPLKRQEANLLTVQEALQNQAAPLAKGEAMFRAPSTLREKAGNLANLAKDPKTTMTQTILRESPATRTATLLQKSLQDLPSPAEAPGITSVANLMQRVPRPALTSGPIGLGGPAESSNPLSQPPPVDATTRAVRLGRLLPTQTGGPIELPYVPEMGGDERLAALMHYLRNSKPPKGLPAKASAIRLGSGQ